MSKYNLDETWKLCLDGMWAWIKEQIDIDADSKHEVGVLKMKWLADNGFDFEEIADNCLFCEYTLDEEGDTECKKCPGRLVDPDFDCENIDYNYYSKPLAFHKKLLELDKARQKKQLKAVK